MLHESDEDMRMGAVFVPYSASERRQVMPAFGRFAVLLGMILVASTLNGKAAAQRPATAQINYKGECRQTLNGKVTADGACRISVKCSSHDAITGEELAGNDLLCYINADGRGFASEPAIRKSGDKLALDKAIDSPYDGTANVSASGSLREDGINATVTKTFVDGRLKGQVLVTTYSGKSEKKPQ
jgi:hypothetical protein